MSKKLSDTITYDDESRVLIDYVIQRIKDAILVDAKKTAYAQDSLLISKSNVLNVMHNLNLTRFMDPED